jgi:hypothetical protein
MRGKCLWKSSKYNFDKICEIYVLHRKFYLQRYVSQALLLQENVAKKMGVGKEIAARFNENLAFFI